MDLLEYQAKELFRDVGIPVLPSQRIDRPGDLKALRIPYPVVLKSQVSVGNRGKAGGIRFVENTIDAIAAARTIFNLPILGEYPNVLLAEAKYNTSQEFYLAIVIDRLACRPVLLGSTDGGMNVNTILDRIHQVVVYEEFSSFYARQLALKMGLKGEIMLAVSEIIEKMYLLMRSQDLDLVEINPLGVDRDGAVMALDGKISVNHHAVGRHPNLQPWQMVDVARNRLGTLSPLFNEVGNIGILCSGNGLALAMLDGIAQGGGQVAQCIVVDPACTEEIQIALDRIGVNVNSGSEGAESPSIDVLLVNFVGSEIDSCQQVMQYLARDPHMTIIWRVLEPDLDRLAGFLPLSIKLVTNFDRAIAQTLKLAKQ
ncbi:ATP-grasp domain-containing protein [Chamaesiphon minutus]|uniref:Succinyl-CoA synthetase, beta subunit n=1 Tax=Chamaesiphon minutus (strain ATCC 27169 / PCC 6605) TaxID=1173020 RepID=K9UJ15_CHAP6|nr:ATP-grasp domain-containing protein [Chamaesiphon minutus]AFY94658.1 succinyl-CoA synthetase, beta subunit [Chamaesiphon minutus PCC 6605]